jgi:hypothetical protein
VKGIEVLPAFLEGFPVAFCAGGGVGDADLSPAVDAKLINTVADGLLVRSGLFYVRPEISLRPLEELFRTRVIRVLVDKGLLPPERAPNRAQPRRREDNLTDYL